MSQLDQQRTRIQDDLRGLISGEVRCDDVFQQLCSSDAGIYEIKPLGVVRPRSAADISACVKYATDKQIPLHARGAGSGVAGESLGPGLIVDFSAHLRRIIRIDEDRVRVQPGVVHERLNAQLGKRGRVFGPDSAVNAISTIGGMIAINTAGSRWLKYGSVRRCVESLQVVLADGEVLELGREPLTDGRSTSSIPRKRELIDRLAELLRANTDLIREGRPACPENNCGYNLDGVLNEDSLDIASLLVGSEGTLALTTEALLKTDRLPRFRGVALLFFDSMDKAARAVPEVLAHGPSACDLMDRRHLSLARETEERFEQLIPVETEALLLVEQDDDDPQRIRERLHTLVGELWQRKRLAFGARQAFEDDEAELYWHLVDKVQSALYRMSGPTRPLPIVEDMSVAPEALPDFIPRVQNVLKRNQVTASLYCHAGQGQLHIQPFLDLSDRDNAHRLKQLAEELYEEALRARGSIGGEHGCGLSRTPFVRRQAGALFDVFLAVKNIFDPGNILNPGKIVGDDRDMMIRYLRPAMGTSDADDSLDGTAGTQPEAAVLHEKTPSPQKMRNLLELQLDWNPAVIAEAVAACNRCGECRTQEERFRMCPLFRILPAEEASPRAKANLLRGVLSGTLDLELLTEKEFKDIADLCVHCHSCRLECPANVDIPRLMRESKGAFTAANGLSLADRTMTRLDQLAALGGLIAPVANWALGNRQMRWLLEKTLGIAQGRKLPRVASRNFMRRAARRRLTRPARHSGQKILYFVDLYANYFDPRLAEATTTVLEHNGVSVYVHPDQKQAGMPSIACGALDRARRLATHNVALLAESVRQGYHIIATEPAAALCLRHEYPQLIDNDDARLVAENSSEVCGFLWNMHTLGKLQLDLSPLNLSLGYHAPCHMRALDEGSPGESLLGLIPGLRVQNVESGCSGMAGTFGLNRKNYRASLRAGIKLISRLRDPAIQAGVTECSACKTQMEQGTDKPTLHPITLLAISYGLIEGVRELHL